METRGRTLLVLANIRPDVVYVKLQYIDFEAYLSSMT